MMLARRIALPVVVAVIVVTPVAADSIAFEQDALGKSCAELTAARINLNKQVRVRRDRLPDFLLGSAWRTSLDRFDPRRCFRKLDLKKLTFPRRGCFDRERLDDGKAIADELRSLMGETFADLLLGSVGSQLDGNTSVRTVRDAGRAIQVLLSLESFQSDLAIVSRVFQEKNCGDGPDPKVTVEELPEAAP